MTDFCEKDKSETLTRIYFRMYHHQKSSRKVANNIKSIFIPSKICSTYVAQQTNFYATLDTIQDILCKLGMKPHMQLQEIIIFSLKHFIVRPTKIIKDLCKASASMLSMYWLCFTEVLDILVGLTMTCIQSICTHYSSYQVWNFKKGPKNGLQKAGCKNQGHCYSKREEAAQPLLFLNNNDPAHCYFRIF